MNTSIPEDMGLKLEDTTHLGVLDGVLFAAIVASGATWVWISLAGIESRLLAALGSPAGRLVAAAIGLASVGAVLRAFVVSRWPVSDNDRSLF
ncbi:MAG: hypothetical protein M3Z15_09375 [Pseudomonadota bacterium]|nr:hypothetical protein [Pseudomonadota bacterium]